MKETESNVTACGLQGEQYISFFEPLRSLDHGEFRKQTSNHLPINALLKGSAICTIGVKSIANPFIRIGSLNMPIDVSPDQSSFSSLLSPIYDSKAVPFGFGCNLSLPSIIQKADKEVPENENTEETLVFIPFNALDIASVLICKGKYWQSLLTKNSMWRRKRYIFILSPSVPGIRSPPGLPRRCGRHLLIGSRSAASGSKHD